MARAARRGSLAKGDLVALGRVNSGAMPELIEPRFCVGSNPTLGLKRKYGGGGIRTHDGGHPP